MSRAEVCCLPPPSTAEDCLPLGLPASGTIPSPVTGSLSRAYRPQSPRVWPHPVKDKQRSGQRQAEIRVAVLQGIDGLAHQHAPGEGAPDDKHPDAQPCQAPLHAGHCLMGSHLRSAPQKGPVRQSCTSQSAGSRPQCCKALACSDKVVRCKTLSNGLLEAEISQGTPAVFTARRQATCAGAAAASCMCSRDCQWTESTPMCVFLQHSEQGPTCCEHNAPAGHPCCFQQTLQLCPPCSPGMPGVELSCQRAVLQANPEAACLACAQDAAGGIVPKRCQCHGQARLRPPAGRLELLRLHHIAAAQFLGDWR